MERESSVRISNLHNLVFIDTPRRRMSGKGFIVYFALLQPSFLHSFIELDGRKKKISPRNFCLGFLSNLLHLKISIQKYSRRGFTSSFLHVWLKIRRL